MAVTTTTTAAATNTIGKPDLVPSESVDGPRLAHLAWARGGSAPAPDAMAVRAFQYQASFDRRRCLRLARGWVAAGIANSRAVLRRHWRDGGNPGAAGLEALLAELEADQRRAGECPAAAPLAEIEEAASARYFGEFGRLLRPHPGGPWGFEAGTRDLDPPRDPVNTLLSLAHAMLAREWAAVLSEAGLDPDRGFHHETRPGRPALALDMMAPFRSLVADSLVVTLINDGGVWPEDFIQAAGGCAMGERARQALATAFERRLAQPAAPGGELGCRRLFEAQARRLVRHLSGEAAGYPSFVAE